MLSLPPACAASHEAGPWPRDLEHEADTRRAQVDLPKPAPKRVSPEPAGLFADDNLVYGTLPPRDPFAASEVVQPSAPVPTPTVSRRCYPLARSQYLTCLFRPPHSPADGNIASLLCLPRRLRHLPSARGLLQTSADSNRYVGPFESAVRGTETHLLGTRQDPRQLRDAKRQ